MTTSTADAIAAFLAKGGKVAKVDAGASSGMTARDWHRAARDPIVTRPCPTEERRVASVDHMGRSYIVNGLGEAIAVE